MQSSVLDRLQQEINTFMNLLLCFFPNNMILYFGKQYIQMQNSSDLIFYFQDFHKLSNDIKNKNEAVFDNPDNFQVLNSYINLPNLWFSLDDEQKEELWDVLSKCVDLIEIYLETNNARI